MKVVIWMVKLINENNMNKKACNLILCNTWYDKTDVFLQIGVNTCRKSLKCYVGTFSGPPNTIEINNLTNPIDVRLIKGFINDKIEFDWVMKQKFRHVSTSIAYEGGKFYLPNKFKIPLSQKLLGRHLFATKVCKTVTFVLVYGNEMLLKSVTVSKASSTPEDVESDLATISDTLSLIHAVPSTSIEGEEYGERRQILMDKDNFDRNESKQKSTRTMKVKCIHCNENTYVKENGIENENIYVKPYENEFEMIEKDSKDE